MPTCKNCLRRNQECSLIAITPFASKSKSRSGSGSRVAVSITSYKPTTTPFNFATPSTKFFDTLDLELFHQYASGTSIASLSRCPEIWSQVIPRLALTTPFVMHALLGVAAIHRATVDPLQKAHFLARASKHESLSLSYFRQLPPKLDDENCHAVYGFSGLVLPYAMASLDLNEIQSTLPTKDSRLPNWIDLLRSTHNILYTNWDWLTNGPFAPLLLDTKEQVNFSNNPDDDHITALNSLFTSHEPAEQNILDVCKVALDALRRTAALPYCVSFNIRAASLVWPGIVSPEYIQLVRERRPEALILLAHYSVLLYAGRDCWCFEKLGPHLLRAVFQCLAPEWRSWIQWPLEKLDMKEEL